MIGRLEHDQRSPDVSTLLAHLVPALHIVYIADKRETVARLTKLTVG